jgi:hypothetical protein
MLLTVGSSVLAVINVVVMWAMAHRWRFAWHGNLALQLAWLPYDFLTRQYGLLALGITMTFVSLKACFYKEKVREMEKALETRGQAPRRRRGAQPRHAQRRPRGRDERRNIPAPPQSLPSRPLGSVAELAGRAAGGEAVAQEGALKGVKAMDSAAEPGCLAGGI